MGVGTGDKPAATALPLLDDVDNGSSDDALGSSFTANRAPSPPPPRQPPTMLPPDDQCLFFPLPTASDEQAPRPATCCALTKAILGELKLWLLPSRTMTRRVGPFLVGVAYLLIIGLLGGLREGHFYMAGLALFDSYNERTRRFLFCFLGILFVGVMFDSMRYYYWTLVTPERIHVAEPYLLDKSLFGISSGEDGGRQTLNEYFNQHHWPVLDVICGLVYLTFVNVEILAFIVLIFFGQARLARLLAWSFCVANCFGYITYFLYPAAPPWYVTEYGLGLARTDIHPNPAACLRFDDIVGLPLFKEMYSLETAVYGTYPSLHVVYPLLLTLVVWRLNRFRVLFVLAAADYVLMCFSAIYLQHHYVMDIVLGTCYAYFAVWAVELIEARLAHGGQKYPLLPTCGFVRCKRVVNGGSGRRKRSSSSESLYFGGEGLREEL